VLAWGDARLLFGDGGGGRVQERLADVRPGRDSRGRRVRGRDASVQRARDSVRRVFRRGGAPGGGVRLARGRELQWRSGVRRGVHVERAFWKGSYAEGNSAATDSAGNVILAGTFLGGVDFGGGPMASHGSLDVFLAKLDASGGHVWSKHFGDAVEHWGVTTAASVATESAGDIALTGHFGDTVDFGGGPMTNTTGNDIFVLKLDAAGGRVWSKQVGDASAEGSGYGGAERGHRQRGERGADRLFHGRCRLRGRPADERGRQRRVRCNARALISATATGAPSPGPPLTRAAGRASCGGRRETKIRTAAAAVVYAEPLCQSRPRR
jgi:hypothetical protein